MAVDIKLVEWSPEYDAQGPLDDVDGAEIPVNHTITVSGRRISVDDKTLIQNNVRTDTISLDLDGEWDGINVAIVIGNSSGKVELSWSGSPLVIPAQIAAVIGAIDVSVVGYSADGLTRLVTVYAPGAMTVIRSGDIVGEVPEEELPSLTAQLMESAKAANNAASAANTAKANADKATTAANSAANSANTAASSARAAAATANGAADDATAAAQNALNIANAIAAIEPPSDDEVEELRDANAVLATAVAELQDGYVIIKETAYMPASRRSALSGETLTVAQASMSGETATIN